MAAKQKEEPVSMANEPVSNLVLITIADGTVHWVFTDLNIRVIVVEPDLIPDGLCKPVRETLIQTLEDLDLRSDLQAKVKNLQHRNVHSKSDPTL
jgi:hypothetical protein